MIEKVNRKVTKGTFIKDMIWDYGCYYGWCWSGCLGPGGLLSGQYSEWCYTTLTHSSSYSYVRCNNKNDCSN
jgi:hypothetical protein